MIFVIFVSYYFALSVKPTRVCILVYQEKGNLKEITRQSTETLKNVVVFNVLTWSFQYKSVNLVSCGP